MGGGNGSKQVFTNFGSRLPLSKFKIFKTMIVDGSSLLYRVMHNSSNNWLSLFHNFCNKFDHSKLIFIFDGRPPPDKSRCIEKRKTNSTKKTLANPTTFKEVKITLNDITQCDVNELIEDTKDTTLIIDCKWISNINLVVDRNYDLIFIDTWHVYGQLKRELAHLQKFATKYIIMHDTEIDKITSESIRNKHDIEDKMKQFNFTKEEVECGLQKAIDEFLLEHHEWKIKEIFTNNNGLTILERV